MIVRLYKYISNLLTPLIFIYFVLRVFFSTEEYNETSKKLKKDLNFKLKISTL